MERERNLIKVSQLCIGLYIKLDGWMGHPFMFSSFKIKDNDQILTLQSLGFDEIEYVPKKSDVEPLAEKPEDEAQNQAEMAAAMAAADALMAEKRERIELLNRERDRIRQAEKNYIRTATSVKNVMRLANTSPAKATELANDVSAELAATFLSDQNPYIHLMGDNAVDENAYYHSLNVTVLSLIIARFIGINEPSLMKSIAMGGILHDIGKSCIPSQILLKDEPLTIPEANLFRMHPAYGVKLLQNVQEVPREVREVIFFHHECADGSGYPKGLHLDAIPQAVRIIAIANAYDNLCNPRVVSRSRTPSESLSYLFKHEPTKYDKSILSAFVKCLGVYPPGTIVLLKSNRIGIVMSIDSGHLLAPNIMLFDPGVPKADAPIFHLKNDLNDEIIKTVRPSALPQPVYDYLTPRKRVCYFADSTGAG